MDQLRNAQGNMHYLFRPGGFFIQARNPSHQVRKSPPNFLMRQARKKLYIGHSHRYDLCAQDPMLPDRTVKTILKKFLAKNPTTTIPVSAEYSLRRKQLSKYVKKAIFVPKLYKIFAQFEEIVFDRADFRRLGRVVSESKYIKSLTLADIQNVPLSCIKQTKKLTNLDSLVLLVKTVWFEKCSVPLNFTRLRKLKKLALKLDSSGFLNVIDQNKFISNFSKFCQNLSKCHQLEKLEIELSAQDDAVLHSIKTLLTSLDVLKIDSFNLVLYCGISLSLEISTIKNLLGKVDYLGFHYQKPSAIKDEKKYSKSLKFICPENMVGLGINDIMNSCQSLATLSLEIPISAMYFPSKLILPKNLKRLYIRFDKERDYEMLKEIKLWSNILKKIPCLEEFGISMLDWRFESYPELVKLHEIDCLRNLKSYSIYITNRQGFIIRDILSDLAEIVEPLKTVETWQFAFDKVVNELEELKFWRMLYGKENMKNLLIRIPKGILDNNVDFPFRKLRPLQQLEKLEIELDEWKKSDVLKKLPALPNIKDLKIYGRKWSIDMIEYDRLRKALLI